MINIRRKILDITAAAFLILFAGWIIWQTRNFEFPMGLGIGYNPAIYPQLLMIFLLILSLILLIQGILGKPSSRDGEQEGEDYLVLSAEALITLGILSTAIVLYSIFVEILGFLLLTPFWVVVMMAAAGERKWTKIFLVGILATGLIYYVFWKLIYVQLPLGSVLPVF